MCFVWFLLDFLLHFLPRLQMTILVIDINLGRSSVCMCWGYAVKTSILIVSLLRVLRPYWKNAHGIMVPRPFSWSWFLVLCPLDADSSRDLSHCPSERALHSCGIPCSAHPSAPASARTASRTGWWRFWHQSRWPPMVCLWHLWRFVMHFKSTSRHEWQIPFFHAAWAEKRGFFTARSSRSDVYRAANNILRLALEGRLLMCTRPPKYTSQKGWSILFYLITYSPRE